MANRYDRDPDEYGSWRRDGRDQARDDDDQREGRFAQGRYGEGRGAEYRQNMRQNAWRDVRNERFDADYRARAEREYHRNPGWRGADFGDNNYYAGRENWGRDSYSSGRDYPNAGDREFRENRGWGSDERDRAWTHHERDRGWQGGGQSSWHPGHGDQQRRDRQRFDRGNYRGLYQEQVWTRDPASGNVYGYEYSTRIDPRRFNAGDESQDRWRGNVSEQNRRFDIDRGWYTPGTSGYGNAGAYQSQYGRGPKGYVRSDERIREDVCDRLSDDDEIDARDVTVTVKGGEVILEGTVNDRRTKYRAEDVAESVSGVKEVTNHLRARKGLLQELGDRISGDDDAEHHGHRGSGTRNSPAGSVQNAQKTAH